MRRLKTDRLRSARTRPVRNRRPIGINLQSRGTEKANAANP